MVKTDILTMAAKNLLRRKSRTVLTMLGVLIGTTSIVVMVSLGIGMMESQQKMYEQWGSLNEITVNQSYSYGDNDTKVVALNDEALEIFKQYEGVTAVIPMVRVSANGVKYGKEEGWLEVYGIDPASMEQKGIEVASGRLLAAGDQTVIVVGGMIGDSFYDPNTGWVYDEDETYEEYRQRIYDKSLGMLNKKVTAEFRNYETQKSKKVTFQVVGVTPVDSPNNYYAYAPLSVMQNIQKVTLTKEQRKDKNRDIYNEVTIVTEDVKYTKEICQSLRDSGYNCYSIAESLEGVEDSMQTVQLVLGGIGSITLLVAAIGIINTMVMSIYERTREIAIMKVIGATFNDIRMMFLAEAGLIGLLGGIFGLIFSYTLSFLLNKFAVGFMGGIGAEGSAISVIPWWLAVFAIVFSILIGLLAGVYPANRAVKLSPIEAMRNN